MSVASVKPDQPALGPDHVAIIMDGNGRWAKGRGLPRTEGHRRGAKAVKASIRGAVDLGIGYLTLFGFSSENWKRPADEVSDLMGLLRLYLKSEIRELDKQGVRFRVIGERAGFHNDIQDLIAKAEDQTKDNGRLTLTVALNYGGRMDIIQAARKLADAAARGDISASDIDENLFNSALYTAGIPDPDLLIRTSGEERISNFLLWQLAYTEFMFMDVLWPDFGEADMAKAVEYFRGRERRFGAVGV